MANASVQTAGECCAISTTSRMASTYSSSCSEVAISGGAAFRTMKLLPQICVRMPFSRASARLQSVRTWREASVGVCVFKHVGNQQTHGACVMHGLGLVPGALAGQNPGGFLAGEPFILGIGGPPHCRQQGTIGVCC